MTLLVSWIGVDDKKNGKSVASLYIASDSRYSWGKYGKYDYGIKVFGSTRYPDIFGFCGDVLFPSIVFGQLIPQIDSGLIFNDSDIGEIKNKKFCDFLRTSLESYPKEQLAGSFTILHGTRISKEFKCYKTTYSTLYGLKNIEIRLPSFSTKVCSEGSGKNEFDKNFAIWESEKHNNHRTSRGVYHCLITTLNNIKDLQTGGKPQIVGLYRVSNMRLFGIVDNGQKYIYGKESSENIFSSTVEWRNENFERVNPETMKLFTGAQRQPI
ncbi:hypothetical protein OKW21_000638 [Catalinimonas alkaloidigena]|uniref:hypothetical protein n=1 Tax=Catalinimonas alkaloidigena TaxID=1075417 RepID=UPI0024069E80|nr:hypothetical protein [Catalinimonas alkaloidigena]MDF9795375.1 hypothetical protein [Catalinimonas alkaloidigena]